MSEITKELRLPAVYLPLGSMEINGIKLRKFQEELFYALDNANKILIEAPTGSGKTFSILVLLAKLIMQDSIRPVVGIYPSRVLVYDQMQSIVKTIEKMGFRKVNEYRYEGKLTISYNQGQLQKDLSLLIIPLTSETKKDVFSVFEETTTRDYKIVLTVPEYPYMYITHLGLMSNFGQIIEAVYNRKLDEVKKKKSIILNIFNKFTKYFNGYYFIDEFHLYNGISRSSLFTLIQMMDDFNETSPRKPKFVFSSATPIEGIEYDKIIRAETSDNGSKIRKYTRLIFHLILSRENPQMAIANYVSKIKVDNRRKIGIIADRVYYIALICKKIKGAVVWGLNKGYGLCEKVNDLRSQNLIVGNNAISFGIDIPDLDIGYIHAHDAETAIQRIGRFGRHGDGEAEVNIFIKGGMWLPNNKIISFYEYIDLIRKMYKRRVEDKLDQLQFSKERASVLFDAYKLMKLISRSYLDIVGFTPSQHKPLKIRPSEEDYFKVFAYRPGGLRGKWCNGGEDDLFTLIRNFEYDTNNQCFKETPVKQNPEVYMRRIIEKGFYTFDEFYNITKASTLINGKPLPLKKIKGLEDSYIIVLDNKDMKNLWGDYYPDMARTVASYASAFIACGEKSFNIDDRECKVVERFLLFI
ncbi:DEAD/DEAH box helicase [Acidianus sulfidivorans JP7]|uniref:CRISPR-associated protein Cas3 n=1 Tax=Acidianus sulfidivorans JP7 TaxID=619593 RepID=A0A2U9IQ66_9CREN|nr:DEAD/DEAH box helicase [Acidianus sulfidivorans]AWR98127.1 DEAD/DEAH box helicase [Acidianus sulfidivorans JP7]